MKPRISELLQVLESFAPAALAEKWDNVGLLVGSPENKVGSILIGLDATNDLVDEALAASADTIITHHPVIFKPLTTINTADPMGRLLQKALSHNINIIAAHTNLDSAIDGVNDVLAKGLGLSDLKPLAPTEGGEGDTGLGRIGRYESPVPRQEFLARLLHLLDVESVNVAGELPENITTVAVCGGSGSDFGPTAHIRGAEVYISAEIKHSMAIWAREAGLAIIDGSHYATEKPATFYLAKKLEEIGALQGWKLNIILTETEKHPFASIHISHLED